MEAGVDSDPRGQVDHLNEAGDAQQSQQVLGLPRSTGGVAIEEGIEEQGGKFIMGTPEMGCKVSTYVLHTQCLTHSKSHVIVKDRA